MSCRLIPNLLVLRPGDANEAVVAAKIAFEQKDKPSLILLTRQKLPVFDRSIYPDANNFAKGGYVMKETRAADITIFCTGSEVWVALEVADILSEFNVRVVNLGCWEIFETQSKNYKSDVIGPAKALKVSIEAGVTIGWQKFTGINGLNFGIDCFGDSGPGNEIADKLGIVPDKIAKKIKSHLLKK
jgi:transketolase